jgi:hypothetical protein
MIIESYTESNESIKITRLRNPIVCSGLLLKQTQAYIYIRLIASGMDAIHFFLECPLYQHNRTSLFNYFNNIVPISIEYILFGCKEISEEFNTLFFKSVQKLVDLIINYPQP